MEEAPPKCANCGAEHEGSSRECPKRAEFLEIRKKASAKNQHGRNRRDTPPPPPVNEENFPRYRHVVPNLKPLEPHRQASRKPPAHDRPSVQPRFAAAAATPSATNTPPPGWGNHERRAPAIDPLDDGTLFPTKLMSQLAITLFERLLASRSKREQINAVVTTVEDFVDRYGP